MLIAIFGNMGSGKTLLMTMISAYVNHAVGVPIYSNYNLENSEPIENIDQLLKINNGIVALDEFWISADSRAWKFNIKLTQWINLTRKKNLLVLHTTQAMSQIDKRIRNASHLIVYCEHFNKALNPFFRYTFINGATEQTIKVLKVREAQARHFYSYYDTLREVIQLKRGKTSNEHEYRP